jgi:S-DNA-T family DNA segregation ATPase FtsK/SpoIIIE
MYRDYKFVNFPEVVVLLEFVAFGSIVSGVLFAQHRLGNRNSTKDYIEKIFRNTGIAIIDRDKEGQAKKVKFPTLIKKGEKGWGMWYLYKLPVGMTYRQLMEQKPLDLILEGTLNKDVLVEDKGGNVILIKIYKHRLPKRIDYQLEWLNECEGYKVVIGVDHNGVVLHDFNLVPHMIMGGMTRYGKSVAMKLIITQLVLKRRFGLKLHLFDLKGGLAFNRFKKLPQVYSVARSEKESLEKLKKLRNNIQKRMMYFEQKGYEDIKEAWTAGEKIDRELIVIDEASVLAPQNKSDQVRNDCRQILEFIAQVAGGLGYNLIMCSQYPTGDILPRQVKQNSDARISFRLPTSTASNVILDESGAEDIGYGMQGRAIYKADLKRVIQVPIIENKEIDKLLKPFIQEELAYGDASGEEEKEGLRDTNDVSSVGYGYTVTASGDSPTGIESKCDESAEEFADIYTAFQGE